MKNKPYFPMFIDLSDKNIVVVGGGNIATRRVKTLLSFTRNIRVIAPKVTMEMMELGKAGYVELITRPVKRGIRTAVSWDWYPMHGPVLVQHLVRLW